MHSDSADSGDNHFSATPETAIYIFLPCSSDEKQIILCIYGITWFILISIYFVYNIAIEQKKEITPELLNDIQGLLPGRLLWSFYVNLAHITEEHTLWPEEYCWRIRN